MTYYSRYREYSELSRLRVIISVSLILFWDCCCFDFWLDVIKKTMFGHQDIKVRETVCQCQGFRCCCWSQLSHLQYSHCSHHQPQPHSSSIPPPARIWVFLFTLLHQCCNSHILTIFPDLGNLKSQGGLHSTTSTLFAGCRFQSGHKMFGCLAAGWLGSW